jgi:DNA-binding HxlR family transcriptional regulator
MQTSATESSRLQLPSLSRRERLRARPEDIEVIERAREVVSLLQSKWTVDVVVLLASGIRRHARLIDNLPGLSKKVLTETLRTLVGHGIVSRRVYAEIPVRVEYQLTPLGWRLTELLMSMYEWVQANDGEIGAAKEARPLAEAGGEGHPAELLSAA